MNLQQLRYVRALVEEGSFVAAAARCAVTQPTLSNGVAQLEAELGQRIFRRTTRSLSLTPSGERLLPAVLETLKAFDKIKDLAMQVGPSKTSVHIGISPVVGIAQAQDALEAFRGMQPDIEIVYREGNLQSLCDALKAAELDLVFAPMDGDCSSLANCVYQQICSEPLMFLPRQGDAKRWKGRNTVELKEIAEETFVLVPGACGLTQVTRRVFEKASLSLHRYPGEASSYLVVQEWSALGLGSAILPASKIATDAESSAAISIVDHGKTVTIDYYALGKPNTVAPEIFSELWSSLRPFNFATEPAQVDSESGYILDWAV